MAKKKKEKENKVLGEGIELSYGFFEQRESRLHTLILKGLIVYLISMGSIGFYLSAFYIDYNKQLCHVAILIMSLLCAMLYYRLLVENLGYLLLLLGFLGLVIVFRRYINSGFYAIVNITVNDAAEYFGVDIQRLYQEQIEDRYLTVTCIVLFIGFVLDVFLNVYISRRMQYVTVAFTVMSLNLIPLYLVEEPDPLYAFMLMSGMVMAYVFKSGQHYSPQVSIKRNDNGFVEKGKDKGKRKSELFYVSDIKAMLQAGVTGIIFVLMVVFGVNAVRPRESFNVGYSGNKYKDITVAAMTTLLVDGWQGFFGHSYDVGGMDSGRLGNVSSVRLDYQTDLIVEFTPYSSGTLYLKGFVGELYNPYANEWTNIMGTKYQLQREDWINTYVPESEDGKSVDNLDAEYAARNYNEMLAYKEAYENNQEYSAKAAMNIWIMDYAVRQGCAPYYTESSSYIGQGSGYNRGRRYEYYPSFGASAVYTQPEYTDLDLYVPEENIPAIQETLAAAGASGSDEKIIQAVIEYYQKNIPYTIRPGRTPRNADFVNYFLTDNKKGYCAHYASAAVLMFRYMGIPARYVEGYAIDYFQVTGGDLVKDAEYGDYYDGYSELGETALVRVNVTDADAHAWVEVYTPIKGWHVVDVTPSGDVEEVEDFWTLFEEYMDDSVGEDNGNNLNLNNIRIPTRVLRTIFFGLIGLAGAVIIFVGGKRGVRELSLYIKYINAGINDKLIYKYSKFRRKLVKKNQALGDLINYREQIRYIIKMTEKPSETRGELETEGEQVIAILERAGFGANEISEAEYGQVTGFLKTMARR